MRPCLRPMNRRNLLLKRGSNGRNENIFQDINYKELNRHVGKYTDVEGDYMEKWHVTESL